MSDDVDQASVVEEAEDTVRPWHGSDNPLEALYQWVVAELAKKQSAAA